MRRLKESSKSRERVSEGWPRHSAAGPSKRMRSVAQGRGYFWCRRGESILGASFAKSKTARRNIKSSYSYLYSILFLILTQSKTQSTRIELGARACTAI